MTLTSDTLEMHEDAKGNQYGTATANKGKVVTIRQERPENFELIEGRACAPNTTAPTAPSTSSARPWWCATSANRSTPSVANGYANEKSGTYEAHGGPNSARPAAGALGGRAPRQGGRRHRRMPQAAGLEEGALSASPQHIRRHA